MARPLSAVLAQLPSLFDDRKIASVERGVTAIDPLPARFQGVKVHLDTHCFTTRSGGCHA